MRALYQNTTGYDNTASGFRSLFSNHTGNYNTASDVNALWANSTGGFNTASGYEALYSNNGYRIPPLSLSNYLLISTPPSVPICTYLNTTGNDNTASGADALYSNTTGRLQHSSGTGALGSIPRAQQHPLGLWRQQPYYRKQQYDIGNQESQGRATPSASARRYADRSMAGIWAAPHGGLSPVYVNSAGQLEHWPSRGALRRTSPIWPPPATLSSRSNR